MGVLKLFEDAVPKKDINKIASGKIEYNTEIPDFDVSEESMKKYLDAINQSPNQVVVPKNSDTVIKQPNQLNQNQSLKLNLNSIKDNKNNEVIKEPQSGEINNRTPDTILKTEKKEYTEEEIYQKFLNSGTKPEKYERWREFYDKAMKTTKNSIAVQKIKKFRFAINDLDALELLPDMEIESMSEREIFSKQWNLNG